MRELTSPATNYPLPGDPHQKAAGAITPERIHEAMQKHGTIFFDHALNPVQPEEGQWFCEYEIFLGFGGEELVREGAIVEYLGVSLTYVLDGDRFVERPSHRVQTEYSDTDREPVGDALIRQA